MRLFQKEKKIFRSGFCAGYRKGKTNKTNWLVVIISLLLIMLSFAVVFGSTFKKAKADVVRVEEVKFNVERLSDDFKFLKYDYYQMSRYFTASSDCVPDPGFTYENQFDYSNVIATHQYRNGKEYYNYYLPVLSGTDDFIFKVKNNTVDNKNGKLRIVNFVIADVISQNNDTLSEELTDFANLRYVTYYVFNNTIPEIVLKGSEYASPNHTTCVKEVYTYELGHENVTNTNSDGSEESSSWVLYNTAWLESSNDNFSTVNFEDVAFEYGAIKMSNFSLNRGYSASGNNYFGSSFGAYHALVDIFNGNESNPVAISPAGFPSTTAYNNFVYNSNLNYNSVYSSYANLLTDDNGNVDFRNSNLFDEYGSVEIIYVDTEVSGSASYSVSNSDESADTSKIDSYTTSSVSVYVSTSEDVNSDKSVFDSVNIIDSSSRPETSVDNDNSVRSETSVDNDNSVRPETSIDNDNSVRPETSIDNDNTDNNISDSSDDNNSSDTDNEPLPPEVDNDKDTANFELVELILKWNGPDEQPEVFEDIESIKSEDWEVVGKYKNIVTEEEIYRVLVEVDYTFEVEKGVEDEYEATVTVTSVEKEELKEEITLRLKQSEFGFWEKIKEFVKNVVERIEAFFKNFSNLIKDWRFWTIVLGISVIVCFLVIMFRKNE